LQFLQLKYLQDEEVGGEVTVIEEATMDGEHHLILVHA
jgi:hypothetical protein